MAHKVLVVAFSVFIAAAPLSAASPGPVPDPSDPADARYCLRVAPATGSLIETVQCWTREQWVEQGVDVDKEWPKEGVTILR